MTHYKSSKSTKQIQAESLVNCLHSVYYLKMTFILPSDDTTLSVLLLSTFGTKTFKFVNTACWNIQWKCTLGLFSSNCKISLLISCNNTILQLINSII